MDTIDPKTLHRLDKQHLPELKPKAEPAPHEHMSAASYRQLLENEQQREAKRKNRSDEDKLCMAFTKHCERYFPRTPGKLMWFHVANQGRSEQQGDKYKKMGVYAGVFDYVFEWPHWIGHLEAKVHKRDYNDNQKRFRGFMTPMPHVRLGKFYSVREGHETLVSWGIQPMQSCTIFREPDFLTAADKAILANDFFAPVRYEKPIT